MGFKKKLLFDLVKKVIRSKNPKGYLRKILIGVTVAILLFTIAAIALVGYSVTQVSGFSQKAPNVELAALESLITEGKLTLSEEQEALVIPLLRDLVTNKALAPEEVQKIEDNILAVLTPMQLEELKQRQEEIFAKTKVLSGISLQVAEDWLSEYVGLSLQEGQEILNSIQALWKVRDPGNETPKELLEQIERQ